MDVTGPHPITKGTQQLGAYKLIRRIGRGGMAEVFLATKDGDLVDRHLVVKKMLPHLADDERFVQMFLREARVAMQLSHPNVVQMLDVGVEGEEYFIAMEHLEGLSAYHLAKRVWASGKSLPLELVAHILCDAALGLEHAHTLRDLEGNNIGLVHRDISPDNIFVTRGGVAKILDFGIALGAFAGSLTRTGEIKGKVRYMSPEQMTKSVGVDSRADIFSLGATFYWLLTGRHAFDGDNDVLAMRAVLESEPPPPSSVNAALPSAIDDVVAAMMAKSRDGRTPSAEAAYEAILPFANGAAGRQKSIEFLNTALALPPVKKRADSESEAPLAVPAAVPAAPPIPAPITLATGLKAAEVTVPRGLELTAPEAVSNISNTPKIEVIDALPEHLTEAGPEHTLSAHGVSVDGETIETAVRPTEARASRKHLVVAAAASIAGLAVAAVLFVAFGGPSAREDDGLAHDVARDDTLPVATAPTAATMPTVPTEPAPTTPIATTTTQAPTPTPTTPPGEPREPVPVADARRPRSTAGRSLRARAPAAIEWRTVGGALLGKGNDTLSLPRDTKQIVAVDARRKGRTRVTVTGEGDVDYGALPKGELSFVVLPFADVYLGKEHLGRTPISSVAVVAGSYEVRLLWNDKAKVVRVDVEPGKKAAVRANMAQP